MNSDSQYGRPRLPRWAFTALALTAVGVAIAQTAEAPSDDEVQSAIDKALRVPFPEVGGPRAAGAEGEVTLGGLKSVYSHTDATLRSVMGPVSFVRYYGMDTSAHTTKALNKRPEWTPFGSMRADSAADRQNGLLNEHCGIGEERYNCRGGLRWWHNFESWVESVNKPIPCADGDSHPDCEDDGKRPDITWIVHAPDGRTYSFEACLEGYREPLPKECYALNHADPDVKLVLKYGGNPYGDGFVLHTPTARYVYAAPLNGTLPPIGFNEPGEVSYRLSYILAPQRAFEQDGGDAEVDCPELGPDMPCQRRMATLHYGSVCTMDGTAVRNGSDTYVTQIEAAGGGKLTLSYKAVYLRDRKQLVKLLADGGTDGKYVPPKECVLSGIELTPPEGDGAAPRAVVSYDYATGPFEEDLGTSPQELGGLLSGVTLFPSAAGSAEATLKTHLSYEYEEAVLPKDGGPTLQPLRTFRVRRNGLFEREFQVDAADGSYTKQTRVGDTTVHLWADNNGTDGYLSDGGRTGEISYCHPGKFNPRTVGGDGGTIHCMKKQTQYQQAVSVLMGDGTGTQVPGVRQKAELELYFKSSDGPLVNKIDMECAGGTCSALAPQQRSRTWAVEGHNPCVSGNCPTGFYRYFAYAPKQAVDSRGNKTVFESRLASEGVGMPPRMPSTAPPPSLPYVEMSSVYAGATQNSDGADALLRRHFTYAYVGNYEQKIKDEWGYSGLVVVKEPSFKVRRHYDTKTGRLTAVVQQGYTLEFDAASNSWQPVLRWVGTFYRNQYSCGMAANDGRVQENAGEAWDRVVEVAGPCLVDHLNAQQCAGGQPSVPLTQYEYWPASAGARKAGRLAVRRVFSRTAGNGTCNMPDLAVDPKPYVETRYEDYDLQGRLTHWLDANGVETRYRYAGDKLVEARVADGDPLVAVTTYGYDNGEGTGNWVRHPDGRYEVQCFRKNTAPGTGCRGGVLTDKLQWKATSLSPDAWIHTERTDYVYAANGQLVGEVVRDSSGAVRRQRYFEGDPLGRTTYEATGSAAPGAPSDTRYHQVSLFDMEGNRVGLGNAYQPTSSPLEPLCGGFSPQSTQAHALPASPLCKAFEYDRLNRLSRLTESLDTQGSQAATTCLTYDGRGNLASVSRAGPGQTCTANAESSVRYVHDDFGNLVEVLAPWARAATGLSGKYNYEYDAAGNLVLKQTPAMRQQAIPTWVVYSYDAMRRVLTARAGSKNGAAPAEFQTLYSYGYDGQVPPPPFCPTESGHGEGPSRVKGRPQVLTDSFGDTWYAYDVHGNPRAHWRVRASGQPARTQACSRAHTPNTPNRFFFYDRAGRMINEDLPGGRHLYYVYYGDDTGLSHRVREVRASLWDAENGWREMMTVLKDAQWEPYGGLKSYAVQTRLSTGTGTTPWRYVDYLRTAPATVPLARCNETNLVSGSDYTGRLKALTVSTEAARNAGQPGDIYKRVYTWKADQVVREDTCVLETGDVAPETVKYAGAQGEEGYDTRGQLRHVTGRPYDLRTYTYDALGNRLSERRGDFVFQLGYAPETGGVREELLRTRGVRRCAPGDASCLQTTALTSPTEQYTYDDDGRLSQKAWTGADPAPRTLAELNLGTGLDATHAAVGAVYRTVSDDEGRTWEYFYDAVGRRRLKLQLQGPREEYFYDDTALLEDWSVTDVDSAEADSVRDEYIWLDGRPVALFKTRVNRIGGRVADFTGTCERYSDDVKPACGVYFPITDVLGKPVLMLNGAGLVTGVADYDAFGHVNRVSHPGESSHPSLLDGQDSLLAATTGLPASSTRLKVHVRARFSALLGGPGSEAYLTNNAFARLPPAIPGGATGIAGNAGPRVVTPWAYAAVPQVQVRYTEAHQPWSEPEGAPWGASLEGLEYRRFQAGATPVWLPLRLPGQYHDVETDLFENWNRYYDASVGRYSAPEPKLLEPGALLESLELGQVAHVYGYANGNPVTWFDPDGLAVLVNGKDTLEVMREFEKKDPDAYRAMLLDDQVYVFESGNLGLQPDGSARLGWTSGLHVTLDFENIDKFGRGSRLWTFAHEAYHSMENGGLAQSFVTRSGKEFAADAYAHKVTGEPYTEQMLKYWRYIQGMDKLEMNKSAHIKKVMERRGR